MEVCVLMSTYNGEKFLDEQLESVFAQKDVKINILVRDDGSSDRTIAILDKWQKEGHLRWYTGKNLRPAKSFMNLVMNAPEADFYAFCDQDDVWLPDKLKTAIASLQDNNAQLYYSSYTTVDKDLNVMQKDVQKPIMKSLAQTLIYASVTGCTMVFTRKLLNYARLYQAEHIMMHDSWLFKIAIATDCRVVYDNKSHILYRQHSNNVIGNKQSRLIVWKIRLNRLFDSSRKRYGEVQDLYEGYGELLSKTNMKQVHPLIGYYNKSLWKRLRIAMNTSFKTNVFSSDLLFKIAIIIKRF